MKNINIHNIGKNKIAFIIHSTVETQEEFNNYISTLITKCNKKLISRELGNVLLGIGGIYENKLSISRSFNEALQVLNYQKISMQKAKELLTQSDITISEIVNKVGYGSYNTFARAFKKINGISATDYRKSLNKTKNL